MDWFNAAVVVEEVYGGEINMREGCFVCPFCDEIIYASDQRGHDWSECPVCGECFEVM